MARNFIIILLAIFVTIIYHSLANNPELANKPEWSTLQSVQSKYVGESSDDPIFLTVGSYDLIGIKSLDRPSRTWLLAKPLVSPLVKTMPQENKVRISQSDFDKIKSTVKLNEETEIFLRNSIE
jgi:hypothetical protein